MKVATMNRRTRLLLALVTIGSAAGLVGAPTTAAAKYSLEPVPQQTWSPNGTVYDILTLGDRVYIAGNFSVLENMKTGERVRRERLAAFDRDTGALESWNPGADGSVRALTASSDGSVVYAGGEFRSAGGESNLRIAAISSSSGRSVPGFQASASGVVRDLLVVDRALFASGAFTTVNGVARRAVVKLAGKTGKVRTAFDARVRRGRVLALGDSGDGRLVIGGSFERLARTRHSYLAAVSRRDGAASRWSPVAICEGCVVLDVTRKRGVVYAAVGGPRGGRAAAWKLGSNSRLWSRGADGDVQVVDVHRKRLYAGGHFGPRFYGGEAHQLVALRRSDGAVRRRWDIPFVGTDKPGVWAVDARAKHLRIGGAFQGIGSLGRAARYAVFAAQ